MKSTDLNYQLEMQEAKRQMFLEIKWKLEAAEDQDTEDNEKEVREMMKTKIDVWSKIAEAIAKVQ